MIDQAIDDRMKATLNHAERVSPLKKGEYGAEYGVHNFGAPRGSNIITSPSLSGSRLYFLQCRDCGRSIFEDGTGSANSPICKYGAFREARSMKTIMKTKRNTAPETLSAWDLFDLSIPAPSIGYLDSRPLFDCLGRPSPHGLRENGGMSLLGRRQSLVRWVS